MPEGIRTGNFTRFIIVRSSFADGVFTGIVVSKCDGSICRERLISRREVAHFDYARQTGQHQGLSKHAMDLDDYVSTD
jgi:hypothetical protein